MLALIISQDSKFSLIHHIVFFTWLASHIWSLRICFETSSDFWNPDRRSKKGCRKASFSVILLSGSYSNILAMMSSMTLSSWPRMEWGLALLYCGSGRQCWVAYLAAGRDQSQHSRPVPPWKKLVLVLRTMCGGKSPSILVIMARCSMLSWVWNRVWPCNTAVIKEGLVRDGLFHLRRGKIKYIEECQIGR